MHQLLGATVRDAITGFSGVVTGVVDYISGCNQGLVVPPVSPEGKLPEPQWLDVQRLVVDISKPRIRLDNGATPGCDRAPPKR